MKMKNCVFGITILFASALSAEEGGELAWGGYSQQGKVILKELKGVVLAGTEEDLQTSPTGVTGLELANLEIPGNIADLKAKIEPLFLNKPLTQELIASIKSEIGAYYRNYNRPLVVVDLPEQDVTRGVVQLVVSEAKLGEVHCKGNRHFTCGQLKRYIRIHPGEEIRSDELLSDVAFMNRNYFRHTDVLFGPGKEENTTDLVLVTKDRMAWRFYTGGDNTGNKYTGEARWFGGLTWGNVFGWDHTFSYQYTGSSNLHDFYSHTFYYSAPTRYHHTVVAYGGFSSVSPDLSSLNNSVLPAGGKLSNDGFSAQGSFRYYVPAGSTWNSNLLEFFFGFDYKKMNNNLTFIGDETIPIVNKFANLTQLVAGFDYALENRHHKLSIELDNYWSPGQVMGGESNERFNNIRNRAKNHYFYSRVSIGETYHIFKRWDLNFLVRGQASNRVLLPSEQFGLGGFNTVRGYVEREFNADNAFLGTVELRLPSFSVFRMGKKGHLKDQLTFLVFGDYAHGWNHRSLSDERKSDWLASVGPALRFNIDKYLNARVDWGFKLHKDDVLGGHYGKVHVSVIASY